MPWKYETYDSLFYFYTLSANTSYFKLIHLFPFYSTFVFRTLVSSKSIVKTYPFIETPLLYLALLISRINFNLISLLRFAIKRATKFLYMFVCCTYWTRPFNFDSYRMFSNYYTTWRALNIRFPSLLFFIFLVSSGPIFVLCSAHTERSEFFNTEYSILVGTMQTEIINWMTATVSSNCRPLNIWCKKYFSNRVQHNCGVYRIAFI